MSEAEAALSSDDYLDRYCPPLDSALVLSVLQDHGDDAAGAQEVLDMLAASAEEAIEFSTTDEASEVERALSEWTLDDADSKSSLESAVTDDPLLFLLSVFPKRSSDELDALLVQQDGDVERTVDELLSRDFIALQVQLEATAAVDSSRDGLSTPMHRKAKKKRTKAGKTISLTDVLHRQAPGGSDSESDRADFYSTGNSWASLDSQASYLAQLLDLDVGFLSSAYHKADSSWAIAVENILDDLEQRRPFETLPHAEELLASTSTQMDVRAAKRLLCGTNGDVAAALDLAQWRAGRSGASVQRMVATGPGAGRRAAVLHAHSTLAPASPLPVVAPGTSALSRSSSNASRSSQRVAVPTVNGGTRTVDMAPAPLHGTASEYRAFAADSWAKHSDTLKQAARHFNSGDKNMRAAAAFLGQRAREFEQEARGYDMRAARAMVKERQATALERGMESSSIDLHNLTVSQALTVVKEGVNAWWASAPYPPPLRIVVGRGSHSVHGKSLIGPAISKYLEREGWRFTRESEAVLKVTGVVGRR